MQHPEHIPPIQEKLIASIKFRKEQLDFIEDTEEFQETVDTIALLEDYLAEIGEVSLVPAHVADDELDILEDDETVGWD